MMYFRENIESFAVTTDYFGQHLARYVSGCYAVTRVSLGKVCVALDAAELRNTIHADRNVAAPLIIDFRVF